MGHVKNAVGKTTKALNAAAPVAMLFPGGQVVSVAAMAGNVVTGLSQKPPNWSGVMSNAVAAALPMGIGKALKSFGGGTSLQFAKLLGEKLSGTLGEVAKRVRNPQFTQLTGQLQSKVTHPDFHKQVAGWVNKATHTTADAHLTPDQIRQSMREVGPVMRGVVEPMAAQIAAPLMGDRSGFSKAPDEKKVVIKPTAGQVDPGTPAFAAPRSYRG